MRVVQWQAMGGWEEQLRGQVPRVDGELAGPGHYRVFKSRETVRRCRRPAPVPRVAAVAVRM